MKRRTSFVDRLALGYHTTALSLLFAMSAFRARGRGTHLLGVGGRGSLTLEREIPLPDNAFFTPGRRFDAVLRHANLAEPDDLAADFKGAALKLFEGDAEVMDFLMNTGAVTVWAHVSQFAERMRFTLKKNLKGFFEKYPDAVERYFAGLRRAPEGFDALSYYGNLAFVLVDRAGERHAFRYRLVPETWKGQDSGLPGDHDREHFLQVERLADETRPKDHLRRAWTDKVTKEPLRYVLEVQREAYSDDPRAAVYDPTRYWGGAGAPWHRLGVLTIERVIPQEALEPLRFTIARLPPSIELPAAYSPTDFTSIGHLRAVAYRWSAWVRGVRRS